MILGLGVLRLEEYTVLKMNKSWDEERKEISVWLSGYFGMVKLWVDKILDNEDLDVNKNKIVNTLTTWIEYLEDERQKIMMLKDKSIGPNDPGDEDNTPKYVVRPTEQQRLDGMDEG